MGDQQAKLVIIRLQAGRYVSGKKSGQPVAAEETCRQSKQENG